MGNKMIKLSKQDWMRIGMEQGFLTKQSQFISGAEAVYNQAGELHQMLDEMGVDFRRSSTSKIDDAAWELAGELQKFKRLLKQSGS